jgi:hypothetical protein
MTKSCVQRENYFFDVRRAAKRSGHAPAMLAIK